jgi:hypothetical protein
MFPVNYASKKSAEGSTRRVGKDTRGEESFWPQLDWARTKSEPNR